jgi:hypothetical protein
MDESREGLVLLLLQERSTAQAVKLYQEETGADLDQARFEVRQLARKHGIPAGRNRLLPYLLILVSGIVGFMLAF